jgi:stage II sporulation protein AA (anti-sigma F factor antagonist)
MGEHYIRSIVFDFTHTTFMDSSGIGMIMGRYRALGMRRDCVRAVHTGERMERLLRLSGVHKYIKIGE